MEPKFKAGDKVAVFTGEGHCLIRNKDSMDFKLELIPYYKNWLKLNHHKTLIWINAENGYDSFYEYIAVHIADAMEIRKLPANERFEAAKRLNKPSN